MRPPTLRTRLFLSYAAVAVVGATALVAVIALLAVPLFDHRVAGMGAGPHHEETVQALNAAFRASLVRSVSAGLAVALVVAALVTAVVARHLLRPVDRLRAAARRLAAGRYDEPVPLPSEPELAALAEDVNALADQLAASERRRAALIGDVVHEMRTPLTTARGYVDGLADGLFAPAEAVAVLGDELARLERLAVDLGTVSRAEEGRLELRAGPVDLAEVAGAVVAHLAPQFTASDVHLASELAAAPVTGDRDRLVQAVTNLVGNALAYTGRGGAVRVRAQVAGDVARVVVADTGAGLDPSDLERVFERFYRAAPHTHAGGTGVGLTIARAIARAHGGDVTAASPGRGLGATFTLSVPLRTPDTTLSGEDVADRSDPPTVRPPAVDAQVRLP